MGVSRQARAMTSEISAADVIGWIETFCRVPEGPRVGEPIVLYGWQRKWLQQVYDNPHGTRLAILSVGRKNAKSTLTACLLLAHLCGPPAHGRLNSQLYSTAQSREQAAVVFHLAVKMVRLHPALARIVTVRRAPRSSSATSSAPATRRSQPKLRPRSDYPLRWSFMMS